jgi:Ca-activated chloride channel family protein
MKCSPQPLRIFAGALLLLAWPLAAFGDSAASAVAEGNRRYGEKKYDEAIVSYQKALQDLPESPDIFFNLGAAEYQKKNYEQSGKLFGRSISLGDAARQTQAAYNLGNSLYREGKFLDALAAFKKAIELDPKDMDAKFNYEIVFRALNPPPTPPPPPSPPSPPPPTPPADDREYGYRDIE